MELYQFSWGSGSDEECYSFYINADRQSVINLMASFRDADGDIRDYDEFENYAYQHGLTVMRYSHEEPTHIHEDELNDWNDECSSFGTREGEIVKIECGNCDYENCCDNAHKISKADLLNGGCGSIGRVDSFWFAAKHETKQEE